MIAILGARGFVGQAVLQQAVRAGLDARPVARTEVDYTRASELTGFLRDVRPQFLINAAGYTGRPNVDACELHKAECLAGNGVLPGVIREVCEDLQIPWGHVSSGCIFTGSKPDGSGFTEEDPPNFSFRQDNCSFYSGCKALGEEVLQGAERCYIWRLRIPFNHIDGPRNYLSKLMRYDTLLQATNSLSHLDEFAAACVACITGEVEYGTYNLTNPGAVTTSEVVDLIRKHGLTDKAFRFFDSEDQFMQLAAKTPRSNCVLDSSKAIRAGLPLSSVHDALEKALREWQPER
ncbi:MAG: sugar nucleotide-binding protein [Planctomycetaceae bacterium]|nr:sugar nucleotide-binding protein [Planctomycetaceae bacterium]